MKTRRDFLAALGLGAGASVLGLPGMAHAWGRRRRCREVCNGCRQMTNECACGEPKAGLAPFSTGTTSCTCACPQYLITFTGINYYYSCLCCPAGTAVNAYTSNNYGLNPRIPCPATSTTACIGTCAKITQDSKQRIYAARSAFDECGFHLDPTAKWKDSAGTEHLHAEAYKNGIMKPQASADLDRDLHNNAPKEWATVTLAGYVNYDSRFVALYDLTCSKALPRCQELYIGLEISDKPATVNFDDWGIPFAKGFPHYHHVYYNGHKYHVATKK